MNLVLDFGNTFIKAGLFENNKLLKTESAADVVDLLQSFSTFKIEKIIVATVVDLPPDIIKHIKQQATTLFFDSNTPIPIKNRYETTSTLGSDRIAAICGAYPQFIGKSFLVIDAGTCLKYNFTDKEGNFIGGGISPGLNMRFRAMHEFTDKLPLIKPDENYTDLIATNTQNSLKMGAQLGFIAEVKEFMRQYMELYPEVNIVLTGGDGLFLQKALKSNIFADPNLILKGLNNILNYQKNIK